MEQEAKVEEQKAFVPRKDIDLKKITWRTFENEEDLTNVMRMMGRDLSEPYPIYTFRTFV